MNLVTTLVCIVAVVSVVSVNGKLPKSCSSKIYCQGPLLETIQLARPFKDSKTFVDLKMKNPERIILANFARFMNATCDKPTPTEVRQFIDANFEQGNELTNDTLPDWKPYPAFLKKIKDTELRGFGEALNNIWPTLAVKIKDEVLRNSHLYSIEPVPHVFVKPGGRFTEPYYWDSYWIVSGLLICDMPITTKGVIENFLWFVDKYGYVPNGGRVYYAERSQPPLLTGMVEKYVEYTKDLVWLRENIHKVETELKFWEHERGVTINGHSLLRFHAPSEGPRPESYREDYMTADQNQDVYTELKSGAETGWDFSSRWFVSETAKPDLKDIKTSTIIPVDLNAIYCGATGKLADLYALLNDQQKSKEWRAVQDKFRQTIYEVLWDEEEGSWFDVNVQTSEHRKKFYPSNLTPLWANCLAKEQDSKETGTKVANYLINSGAVNYPGGLPTSLDRSGEQWDFPNAWPPLQDIVITGLENSGSDVALKVAYNLTERWVISNYRGFKDTSVCIVKS